MPFFCMFCQLVWLQDSRRYFLERFSRNMPSAWNLNLNKSLNYISAIFFISTNVFWYGVHFHIKQSGKQPKIICVWTNVSKTRRKLSSQVMYHSGKYAGIFWFVLLEFRGMNTVWFLIMAFPQSQFCFKDHDISTHHMYELISSLMLQVQVV